jgi:hypothetical protein
VTSDDQIQYLWQHVAILRQPGSRRFDLGEALLQLRRAYSERERQKIGGQSAGAVGHGEFEAQCLKRGIAPRTARELISDYEIEWSRLTGHAVPGTQTSAEKRREARQRRPRHSNATYEKGYRQGYQDAAIFLAVGVGQDDFSKFARLLPYKIAKSAFRAAAQLLHPDHGGSPEAMTLLNELWERLEPIYIASGAAPESEDISHEYSSVVH